jgi:hypothetical protein
MAYQKVQYAMQKPSCRYVGCGAYARTPLPHAQGVKCMAHSTCEKHVWPLGGMKCRTCKTRPLRSNSDNGGSGFTRKVNELSKICAQIVLSMIAERMLKIIKKIFPAGVVGKMSPYPTVVNVTTVK